MAKSKKSKSPVATRTVVAFLLDRSGSMGACRDSTIEAFNAYLGGLRENPTEGERIEFTFLQFDTGSLDKVCVAQPIADVPELTMATYVPRGGTPLIDASVKTIRAVEASLKDDSTAKVVICIQTDGEENASNEHTWEELSTLVKTKSDQGWQFNFMGAGIDAYAQGARMGIQASGTMSYDHRDRRATRAAFAANAANTRAYGAGLAQSTSYTVSQRVSSGDRFAPGDLGGLPVGAPNLGGLPVGAPNLGGLSSAAPLDLTTPSPVRRTTRTPHRGAVPDLKL